MNPKNPLNISFRITDFILSRPYRSLILATLFVVISGIGLKFIKADFGHKVWFRDDDPLLMKFEAFENSFGNDDSIILVIHNEEGLFNPKSIKLIHEMTKDMWSVSEVMRVDSLTNYNWVQTTQSEISISPLFPKNIEEAVDPDLIGQRKKVALEDETIKGYLISPDGKTAFIFAQVEPTFDSTKADFVTVIGEVRNVIKKHQDKEHTFYLSGGMAVTNTFKEASTSDMKIILPLLNIFLFGLLWFYFRSHIAIWVPAIVIFFGILSAWGLGGWSGVKINALTAMIPKILLAISLSDVIHFISSFFHYRRLGLENDKAVRVSYTNNFVPVFLTSFMTAIGFWGLTGTKLVPIAYLGLVSSAGAMCLWLLTLLIVGPMLILVKPKVPVLRSAKNTDPHGGTLSMLRFIKRFPNSIVIVTFLICLVSIWSMTLLNINSNPYNYFKDDVPLKQANSFIRKASGGVVGPEIIIHSGTPDGVKDPKFLEKVEKFQTWLNGEPYVSRTIGIIDILKQINRALNGGGQEHFRLPDTKQMVAEELLFYTMGLPQGMDINNRISLDNEALRLTVMWNIEDSKATLEKVKAFEDKLKEYGLHGTVTGKLLLYRQMNDYVVETFYVSVVTSFCLICLILILTFKSIGLGLLSMVPNIIPLFIGAGFMAIIGKDLDFGSVIVGSVCLGIAVDDTIYFLTYFQRYKKDGLSTNEALEEIYKHVTPSLIKTTVILSLVFGTFIFGKFVPNVNFGFFTALILGVTLVMDIVFLPALLLVIERLKRNAPPG